MENEIDLSSHSDYDKKRQRERERERPPVVKARLCSRYFNGTKRFNYRRACFSARTVSDMLSDVIRNIEETW